MISVIIRRGEEQTYLTRCYNSIQRQSYKDTEVILVTKKDISKSEIGEKMSKIAVSEQEAIASAEGDYLFFCSSTSVLAPNVLQMLMDSSKEGFGIVNHYVESKQATFVVAENTMFSCDGKLYKKDIIQERNIEFSQLEMAIDYCAYENNIIFLEDACVYDTSGSVFVVPKDQLKESAFVSLLKKISLLNKEVFDHTVEQFSVFLKEANLQSEELLYAAEEIMHDQYEMNYTLALPFIRKWWDAIRVEQDKACYEKLVSYLKKYEEDEYFLELLMGVCGLKKEQYPILKDNDMKNAMFFLVESSEQRKILHGAEDGFVDFGSKQYYYRNGKLYTGLLEYQEEFWYMENGVINKFFNGLVENEYGIWAVVNGKVPFDLNGYKQFGTIRGVFCDGRVDTTIDGFLKQGKTWYYFKEGIVDENYTGLAKNEYGWWYLQNGVIDTSYEGLADNEYGTWAVQDGTINEKLNGYQRIGGVHALLVYGKLDKTKTGLYKPNNEWIYFKEGIADTNYTGLAKNEYGWWYFANGKMNLEFNGFVENEYGLWKVENGTIVSKKAENISEHEV